MSENSVAKKASWTLFWLCWICYAIISMTRNAYSASIAAIIDEGIFTKSQAGLINSGFYLLYGAAQLFCGKLLDTVPPVKLVSITLIGSGIATVAMGMAKSYIAMLIIWCLCGLVQFGIWPIIIRIIAELILPEHKSRAMVYITFSYCIGSLLNYVLAAIVLKWLDWKLLFYISGIILFLTLIFWVVGTKRTVSVLSKVSDKSDSPASSSAAPEKSTGFLKMFISSGCLVLSIPVFARTSLDLGIKSWIPTMIMESYKTSESFATALMISLLVFNIFGVFFINFIYPRRIKSEPPAFATCFLISLPFTALLLLIGKMHLLLALAALVVLTTMMYAANQFSTVFIPAAFAKYNRVGSVAAILNAVASFGAVIATTAFGFLSEHYGWNGTIISWIIIIVISSLTLFAITPAWNRFVKGSKKERH